MKKKTERPNMPNLQRFISSILLVSYAVAAFGKDIQVSEHVEDSKDCGASPCYSLHQAVENADWNDVIYLPSKPSSQWQSETCRQRHMITKNITIHGGEQNTVIDCNGIETTEPIFSIKSNGDEYVNFKMNNLELRNIEGKGIFVEGANITIKNGRFSKFKHAIRIIDKINNRHFTRLYVRNSIFHGYRYAINFYWVGKIFIDMKDSECYGNNQNSVCIRVFMDVRHKRSFDIDSSSVNIHNSVFAWNRCGICISGFVAEKANYELHGVVFRENYRGISITRCEYNKRRGKRNEDPNLKDHNVVVSNTNFYNNFEVDIYILGPRRSNECARRAQRANLRYQVYIFNTTFIFDSKRSKAKSSGIIIDMTGLVGDVRFVRCTFEFYYNEIVKQRTNTGVRQIGVIVLRSGNFLFQYCNISDKMGSSLTETIHSESKLTLQNVRLQGHPPLLTATGETTLIDTVVHSTFPSEHVMSLMFNSLYFLTIDNFEFNCPRGNSVKRFEKYMHISNLLKGITRLEYYCKPCPPKTYSLDAGSEKLHGFTHLQIKTQNPKCINCPYGATCFERVIANPGYWGIERSKKLSFSRCPNGYCCEKNCTGIDGCASGRNGTLCGRCIDGHSENVINNHCTTNDQCDRWWISIVVFAIAIVYALIFLYLQDILNAIFRLMFPFRRRADKEQFTDSRDSQDDNSSFPSMIKTVLYFYQLQFFLDINGVPKLDEAKERFKKDILDAMNFQPTVHWISGCPFKGLNAVTKKLYMTQFNIYIYVVLFLIYIFIKLKSRCTKTDDKAFIARLCRASTVLILINVTSLANTALTLLNCVHFIDKNVLFIQGDITCFQPWQYAVIAYFALFIIPVIIVLIRGVRLLQEDKLRAKDLIISLAFPMYFLLPLMRCSTGEVYREKDDASINSEHADERERLMDQDDEDESENHFRSRSSTTNTNNDDLALSSITEVNTQKSSSNALSPKTKRNLNKESVLEVLAKPFLKKDGSGPLYWEGILLIRRLGVVVLSAMISNVVIRLYAVLLLLTVSLFHHERVQPFRHKSVNTAELLSLIVLCALCSVNLFFAHYIMDGQLMNEVDKSIAVVLEWIIFIVAVAIPVCLSIVLAFGIIARIFFTMYSMSCRIVRKLRPDNTHSEMQDPLLKHN